MTIDGSNTLTSFFKINTHYTFILITKTIINGTILVKYLFVCINSTVEIDTDLVKIILQKLNYKLKSSITKDHVSIKNSQMYYSL